MAFQFIFLNNQYESAISVNVFTCVGINTCLNYGNDKIRCICTVFALVSRPILVNHPHIL